jgi:citrate lyase gamma subunit
VQRNSVTPWSLFTVIRKQACTEEIETVKAFQDVLGEMHDCDVWTQYIPKFIQETNAKTKPKRKKKTSTSKTEKRFINFLNYVKQKRKEHYIEFVSLWDKNKEKGFFIQLRKKVNADFGERDEEKIKHVLANPDVKIAVLSDVHANLQALESVFQDAEERGVDVFLNAGDSIGFGSCPNEVVELLMREKCAEHFGQL